ncbi:hypothetical protein LINPERHAP1_LOCUS19998 [Linum perenne]
MGLNIIISSSKRTNSDSLSAEFQAVICI